MRAPGAWLQHRAFFQYEVNVSQRQCGTLTSWPCWAAGPNPDPLCSPPVIQRQLQLCLGLQLLHKTNRNLPFRGKNLLLFQHVWLYFHYWIAFTSMWKDLKKKSYSDRQGYGMSWSVTKEKNSKTLLCICSLWYTVFRANEKYTTLLKNMREVLFPYLTNQMQHKWTI